MALFLVTAPTIEPITLVEAKAQCRIETPDDDGLIDALIKAAREYVESATHRALLRQTWDWKLDAFPSGSDTRLVLPLPPVSSVTSVTYVDTAGATQTWDSSDYRTSLPAGPQAGPGTIEPAYGEVYPSTRDLSDAVVVRVVCGYGTTADTVPSSLRSAIKLLVAHWFARREPINIGNLVSPIPLTIDSLLWPYKAW